ncbi:MAG: ATP synthase F1 subunit delta, partial [Candidatus Margulisbacteria bacterium]|nr:ATP synthase F1 subunit delta [Candidatus Margulisiibacteriota bacterium]
KLYELAHKHDEVLPLEEELFQLKRLLERDFDARLFFESLEIGKKQKKNALKQIFTPCSPVFKALVGFLIDEDKVSRVTEISERYSRMVAKNKNMIFGEVLSYEPLSKESLASLGKRFGKNIVLKNIPDPSLMGGMLIRLMGGTVIDASLKGRLNQLREKIANAS